MHGTKLTTDNNWKLYDCARICSSITVTPIDFDKSSHLFGNFQYHIKLCLIWLILARYGVCIYKYKSRNWPF